MASEIKMKSFQLAERKLRAISPIGKVIVEVRGIQLQTDVQANQLFIHLTTGGKFKIRYDLNKDVQHCSIDLSRENLRMQNVSIQRIGQDTLLKVKKH